MSKYARLFLLTAFSLISSSPVLAEQVFNFGYTLSINEATGSGQIITDNSKSPIVAGNSDFGFDFGGHVNIHIAGQSGVSLMTTAGFSLSHYSENSGDYISSEFNILHLDGLAYFYHREYLIGGGVTYHIHPTLFRKRADTNQEDSWDYNSQLGYVAAIGFGGGYKFPLWFNLRYTFIDYYPASPNLRGVNGDSLGLYVGFNFD